MLKPPKSLAVIGSGPSALYLLQHLLRRADVLSSSIGRIVVYERSRWLGRGFPYNPDTTDRYNICNISSAELPALPDRFVDWLSRQDVSTLESLGCKDPEISEDALYCRLALGAYFADQFDQVMRGLVEAGINVEARTQAEVIDLVDHPCTESVDVMTVKGNCESFGLVVIATGHTPAAGDQSASGYFASPWPIRKLLPATGVLHNFTIGLLGASLSAIDVVASLAHRHGKFTDDAVPAFEAKAGAECFRLVMHDANGWLPHLQYGQRESMRDIYRHVTAEQMKHLCNDAGLLRLDTYFDRVCRPALHEALKRDAMDDASAKLACPEYLWDAFIADRIAEHESDDAFAQMRQEMSETQKLLRRDKPTHWKEVLDDLMYTLNYHSELLPAEDHQRLRQDLMPFVMNVIAAMPLKSARLMLTLHAAGRLTLVSGKVEVKRITQDGAVVVVEAEDGSLSEMHYQMFIDCSGQDSIDYEAFPFRSLIDSGTVAPACGGVSNLAALQAIGDEIPSGTARLQRLPIGGVAIDRRFRLIDEQGDPNPRIYNLAFPQTLGLRPYPYGLQACNENAELTVEGWIDQAGLAI